MKKGFIILFILLIRSQLLSAEKMRVAVLNLKTNNVSKIIAMTVEDLITTELIKSGNFIIVERNQIKEIY